MTVVGETYSRWPFAIWCADFKDTKKIVVVVVAIALLLDSMLLTTVVPIIPKFLYNIRHPGEEEAGIRAEAEYNKMMTQSSSSTSTSYTNGTANFMLMKNEKQRKLNLSKDLGDENVEVGVMFASKAVVQLLANPFVGPLTNRIGYSIPMFCGFLIMFLSTLIFAFGKSFGVLFFARSLQGIGSSCSSVSGMGMLAEHFPEDKERGNAMGLALGGLALGLLIGPPFGGAMYQFVGKTAPFLLLAGLALGDGLLQLVVLRPKIQPHVEVAPSIKELLKDSYIIVAAGAITFANLGIAMMEPTLPIYMMDKMDAAEWELGAVFLPASVCYLVGTNLFGPLGHRIGRWLAAMLGLIIIGICLLCIPMASNISHLILPNAGLGFAIGMVDSSMMPELGYLVDIRHAAVYGSVYAIGDVAFCLGFAIGPAVSGSLVKSIGFKWMLVGVAVLTIMYAPVLLILRNPPTKEEEKSLVLGEKTSVNYVNYNDLKDDVDEGPN